MLKPGTTRRGKAKKSTANSSISKKTAAPVKKTIKKAVTKKAAPAKAKQTTKNPVPVKPTPLNFTTTSPLLFESKLSGMVNIDGFLKAELNNIMLQDKKAAPTALKLLSAEEKIRLEYDGLSTSITSMATPIKLISFGELTHLRWWDAKIRVKKPNNYTFDMNVSNTGGDNLVISRVWSQADQRKRFYVKYANGALTSLDDVNKENIHFFFIEDALKESNTQPIVLCEGYRAAAHLRNNNINAIGTIDGGTLPNNEVLLKLKNQTVLLWPDNDDIGMRHMSRIRARLLALDINADHLIKFEGGAKNADAADIENPNTLNELINSAKPWPLELIMAISGPAKMKRVSSQLKLRANSIITRGGK